MAKPWKEVDSSPEFRALPNDQKIKAQNQYFEQVVAPKAGDNVDRARQQFFSAYNYAGVAVPKAKAEEREVRTEGSLEAFGEGVASGLANVGRGFGLLPEQSQRSAELESIREQASPIASTAGEIAGEVAPFLIPGAGVARIAGTGARIAATGALGALEGGITARGRGEDILPAAGTTGITAASIEAVLPGFIRGTSKIARKVLGRDVVVDSAGDISSILSKSGIDEDSFSQAVINKVEKSQGVDKVQLAREQFLREQGIDPTKAQVTRLPSDITEQQDLAKFGGPVQQALSRQNEVMNDRVSSLIDEIPVADDGSNVIRNSLVDHFVKEDAAVTAAYAKARESAEGLQVSPNKLKAELESLKAQSKLSEGLIPAVSGTLKNIGEDTLTLDQMEDLRKIANATVSPVSSLNAKRIAGRIKQAIDDDVVEQGGDAFANARSLKAQVERSKDIGLSDKFDKTSKSMVRDVLANKIPAEKLVDNIISKTRSERDITAFMNLMNKVGAEDAVNQVRHDVLSKALDRSLIGNPNEVGQRLLNAKKFNKFFNDIGKKKLDSIFTAEQLKGINDISNTLKLIQDLGVGSGPSAKAVWEGLTSQLGKLPGFEILANTINNSSVNRRGGVMIKGKPEKIKSFAQATGQLEALLPAQITGRGEDE